MMAGGETSIFRLCLHATIHPGGELTCEVEATNVVVISILDQAPDLGLLQVVETVVVSSAEVSAERAVVAGDDDTAAASLLLGVDAVLNAQASLLDSIVQDSRVLVITGTAEVDDAVGGQDVLGTAGGVLGGATGNELGVVVVEKVFVEGNVLLLGEDGVVGLEAVLVEEGLVAEGLDVCNVSADLGRAEGCQGGREGETYPGEGSRGRGERIPCWQPS